MPIPCPHCGTYRLLGDAPCDCRTKLPPVIIGEGDIDDQIRYAIRCVCGEDRVIQEIQLCAQFRLDPNYKCAKQYVVTSRSKTCECESPCEWMDHVYWWRDRAVVIKQSDMHATLIGNVIRQLRGE